MQDKTIAVVVGVISVTILESFALAQGIDGAMLSSAFTVIGGLIFAS